VPKPLKGREHRSLNGAAVDPPQHVASRALLSCGTPEQGAIEPSSSEGRRRGIEGQEEDKIKGLIFFDLKSLKALRMWG